MRIINQAIKRERHPMPTIEDLIHVLKFSQNFITSLLPQIVDISPLLQLTLGYGDTKDSSLAQILLVRFFRKASKIIQHILNISDDVIILGKTEGEHDQRLEPACHKLAH